MAFLNASDALGIVGLLLLLTGFIGNLVGRVPATGAPYAWLNFTGSALLAVYSVLIAAWVFFPLEVVWAAAALVSIVRGKKKPSAPTV